MGGWCDGWMEVNASLCCVPVTEGKVEIVERSTLKNPVLHSVLSHWESLTPWIALGADRSTCGVAPN